MRAEGSRTEVSAHGDRDCCKPGSPCPVWGLAQGTWLLTEGSGLWASKRLRQAGAEAGQGARSWVETGAAVKVGARAGDPGERAGPGPGPSWGLDWGWDRTWLSVRLAFGQGPRLGQDGGGGEEAGPRGAQQSQGSTPGQMPLLWVTAVARGRCQTWAPLRGPLSFLVPHLRSARVGSPGGSWEGLGRPAHLTQLSRPRGSSLPLPTPQLGLRASGRHPRPDLLGCPA